MSIQQVEAFREKINADPALQQQATKAFNTSVAAVVALGAANGYQFTEAEAEEAIAEYTGDGELSDYELELVSAGSGCAQTGSTGVSKNT